MALLLVGVLGFATGFGAARIALRALGSGHGAWREADTALTEVDRTAIASEFAGHTDAVWSQVRDFADALADGDVQLRERLRQFEGGR